MRQAPLTELPDEVRPCVQERWRTRIQRLTFWARPPFLHFKNRWGTTQYEFLNEYEFLSSMAEDSPTSSWT